MPTRRLAALAVLVPSLQACMAWTAYQDPIPTAFAKDPPPEVRVTTLDGRRMELHGPTLVSDSLLGLEMVTSQEGRGQPTQRRVAMALRDVTRFETRRPSTLGIALITIPVGAAVGYLGFSVLLNGAMGD